MPPRNNLSDRMRSGGRIRGQSRSNSWGSSEQLQPSRGPIWAHQNRPSVTVRDADPDASSRHKKKRLRVPCFSRRAHLGRSVRQNSPLLSPPREGGAARAQLKAPTYRLARNIYSLAFLRKPACGHRLLERSTIRFSNPP